jgi:hypothetical protein
VRFISLVSSILYDPRSTLRPISREWYVSKVVEVLRKYRKFRGVCGLCEHFMLSAQYEIKGWGMYSLKDEHASLVDTCLTDYR